ncbi:hypothetical protein GCM10007147_16330 [Nocardiopsis kunsanensis]|uniref:Uncharacterized protein n=1 Tax=Nocardiopsis kunsanensis TaxID=141693 RepID=A0A919CGQ1_9ACTN|nr:hypothetical protein [Nocardiopsis kunsanensis]GHD22260.1 hypothetical protein GCM10007147_16330 [Nocardiopsis kunsanensis]
MSVSTPEARNTVVPSGRETVRSLPELGTWEPELGVHVVVRAEHAGADPAPLLADLAAQTYPAALTEVTVAGGTGVHIPDGARPERTRVETGDGGALLPDASADPSVVLWLEAGDRVPQTFVEAHLRGHHHVRGLLLCSTPEATEQDEEGEQGTEGDRRVLYERTGPLWPGALRSGASAPRSVLEGCAASAGGELPAQEEILHHLLLQHGALPATDPEVRHEPRTRHGEAGAGPLSRARVAQWVPTSPERAERPGTHWRVPLAHVVVDTAGTDSATVVDTVDRLLERDTSGTRITLRTEAGSPMESELRAHFRADPRIRVGEGEPVPDPLVPFVLSMPGDLRPETDVARVMVEEAQRSGADVVRATVPGSDLGGPRLERTAARARAAHRCSGADPVASDLLHRPAVRWIDGQARLLTPSNRRAERRARKWERLHEHETEAARMRVWERRLRRRLDLLTRTRVGRFWCRVLG